MSTGVQHTSTAGPSHASNEEGHDHESRERGQSWRETISTVGGAVWSSLPALRANDGDDGSIGLRALGCAEILKISNALHGIFASAKASAQDMKLPELPQIVVIGGQSSGKSSLLNGIMSADILPLGEQMVTRCPLHLQLVNSSEGMKAEFGEYQHGGVWNPEVTLPLSDPNPTPAEIRAIRDQIDLRTEERAGNQKAISSTPIFLKIHSPYVPDLSLVDLPGLTMTALTDQGQPADIREQIQKMLSHYAGQDRSIILAVVPARADLEADMALHFVRQHDQKGGRTLGVMTKIDLMNQGTDVAAYLSNAIPKALQLKYGYFLAKNRSTREVNAGMTVQDGYAAESAFFESHPVYSKCAPLKRTGVPSLANYLSGILVDQLKQHLPSIMREVDELAAKADANLAAMGTAVPSDSAARSHLVHVTIAELCREFSSCLEERRAHVKTGRHIKDHFIEARGKIAELDAFNMEAFSDAYITEGIRDCEGNHLSFPIPPVEVLETLLKDPKKRPMQTLLVPARECVLAVHDELVALVDTLLEKEHVARFPGLVAKIKHEANVNVLRKCCDEAMTQVERLVTMEESYIYTDDELFHAQLQKLFSDPDSSGGVQPRHMRALLQAYFKTAQLSIQNSVPKAIMLCMVKAAQEQITTTLFENVASAGDYDLVNEPPEVAARRAELRAQVENLHSARRALASIR